MRVRCLTTGRVRGKRRTRGPVRYLPGGWSDETLPVHAFAVYHPRGICLFDTGQTARAAQTGYLPRWHPFLRLARFELGPHDEAGGQVDPGGVRWVVLSHLHTDHVGGLHAFSGAEVLVTRVEWERASGVRGRLRGYLPQHWPEGCEPTFVDFADVPAGRFARSYDVAGDGTLQLVPLPGHTPGHAGLLVEGRVLLAGDAAVTAQELVVLGSHDESAPELAEAID